MRSHAFRQSFGPAVFAIVAGTGVAAGQVSLPPTMFRLLAYENESTFIVALGPSGYYIIDGSTGRRDTGYAGAADAINAAIDAVYLAGDGGRIFIKEGLHSLASRIDIVARSGLTIEGSEGAILTTEPDATGMLIDDHSSHITLRGLHFRDCSGIAINLKSGSVIAIEDCSFTNIQESALQVRIGDDPDDPVENLRFVHNTVSGAGLSASGPALHIYRTHDALIADNIIENGDSGGINVQKSSGQIAIRGNIIRNNGQSATVHGIYVGSGSAQVIIADNVVMDNAGNGLEAASGDGLGSNFVITGNTFTGNARIDRAGSGRDAGIYVTGSGHIVANNVVEMNWGPGIKVGYSEKSDRILITGNSVRDNGLAGEAGLSWSSGIVLTGPSSGGGPYVEHVVVRDNVITDQLDTQPTGIYAITGADGVLVADNYLDGHDAPQIQFDPLAVAFETRDNHGFADTSRGSFSITPGSADHGSVDLDLAATLDIDDIVGSLDPDGFTAALAGGLAPDTALVTLRTEHLGGSVFRVHWVSDTGLTGLSIRWSYNHNP